MQKACRPKGGQWESAFEHGRRVYSTEALSPAVMAGSGNDILKAIKIMKPIKIRKLTPKECWRLMGFSDEDHDKAAKVVSESQRYKQAGNSIVVNVLMAILGQIIPGKEDIYKNEQTHNVHKKD